MDLEKIVSSKTNVKILKFFDENPHCIDTAAGIATWTGLSVEKIKKALIKLARQKVIIEHKTSSAQGYAYTHDDKIIARIKKRLNKKRT